MEREHRQPEEDRALQYAFRVLGYRARSECELRQRLERKGYPANIVDRTLARLFQLGLLDDREFTRAFIASRPGRGPAYLKQELRRKGICRDLAEEMIATGISAEKELADAWQLAQRALQTTKRPLERTVLLRLRRLLYRRGYSIDVIGEICARMQAQSTAEDVWLD